MAPGGDTGRTHARVALVVAFSAVVWTPVGVWIGLNPRAARVAQPVVQVLASFPASFLISFSPGSKIPPLDFPA
jgi:NitT/TauT family transport system permease protein